MRPYHRISANLVLTSTEYASSVPPFNAQKLLAQAGADGVAMDEQAGAEPDAEVSYVTRDLAADPAAHQARRRAAGRRDHRPRARHRELDRRRRRPATRSRACRREARAPLAYAADGTPDPYAGFETRIVPENITLLAEDRRAGDRRQRLERARGHGEEGREHRDDPQGDRRDCPTRSPRSHPRSARAAARTGSRKARSFASCATGEGRAPAADPRHRHGRQHGRSGGRALRHADQYVSVDVASMNTVVAEPGERRRRRRQGACGSTRASTRPRCATTFRKPVIEALIRIYSYDVDFQHKAQPGDSFDVLFAADEDSDGQQRYQERRVLRFARRPAASSASTIASRPPTTASSTTTTRPERARRSSW